MYLSVSLFFCTGVQEEFCKRTSFCVPRILTDSQPLEPSSRFLVAFFEWEQKEFCNKTWSHSHTSHNLRNVQHLQPSFCLAHFLVFIFEWDNLRKKADKRQSTFFLVYCQLPSLTLNHIHPILLTFFTQKTASLQFKNVITNNSAVFLTRNSSALAPPPLVSSRTHTRTHANTPIASFNAPRAQYALRQMSDVFQG